MKKVIIITGGTSGLGKEIAKKLSDKNSVIILSRNNKKLKVISKKIGCDSCICDISDYSRIKTTIKFIEKKYKRIDCLINCAALWIQGTVDSNNPKDIQDTINVNTTGTILMTKAVIPQMKKHKSGRIIMINSGAGLNHRAERSIYTASKWAITGFTKALQDELPKYGIGVTGIYPGKMTPSMRNDGKKKNVWPALTVEKLAKIIEYIISFENDIVFTEIEVKHIKT